MLERAVEGLMVEVQEARSKTGKGLGFAQAVPEQGPEHSLAARVELFDFPGQQAPAFLCAKPVSEQVLDHQGQPGHEATPATKALDRVEILTQTVERPTLGIGAAQSFQGHKHQFRGQVHVAARIAPGQRV